MIFQELNGIVKDKWESNRLIKRSFMDGEVVDE